MKKVLVKNNEKDLKILCVSVRGLVEKGEFIIAREMIRDAMSKYPHAPQPHNLLGILLQKTGEIRMALNHFRVAWCLDPTYAPAEHNISVFSSFFNRGECAYDETDIKKEK